MGGRGASSSKGKGFSWTTLTGRKMTVEKKDGTVFVNGEPNNLLDYDKLLQGAKKQPDFKMRK